jgi:hypothetical protein
MDMHWTNRSRNSPFLVLRGAALLRGDLTSARADAQNRVRLDPLNVQARNVLSLLNASMPRNDRK